MSGVSYLSSNGIALLIRYHRQMRQIGGRFRIVAHSNEVGHVLKLTGVLNLLMDDEPLADAAMRPAPAGVTIDGDGMTLQVFKKSRDARCRTARADRRRRPGFLTAVTTRLTIEPGGRVPGQVAIGLGALGPNFEACRDRFGEFLAAAGVSAYRPSEGSGQPDFEQAKRRVRSGSPRALRHGLLRERRGDDGPLRVEGGARRSRRSLEQACPGCSCARRKRHRGRGA